MAHTTRRAGTGVTISLGGKAVVCCVHDRVKREVVTEEQVWELAKELNFELKKGIHFIFKCSCCENLFVDEGTEPRYCVKCRAPHTHAPGGPLPEPKGVIG